jgi:hypothetical protein
MNRDNLAVLLLSKIKFSPAVLGNDRARRNEVEDFGAALNCGGQLFSPLVTRADALVVPDIDTVVVKPGDLPENGI